MASLKVETPAAAYPVSLAEAKNWLRVTIDDDDSLIRDILIPAATSACETYTGRCFCYTGFIQTLDSFPYYVDSVQSQQAYPPSYYAMPRYSTTLWNYSQMIKLFRPKLKSIDRITYLASGDQQWHDLLPVPELWYPGKTHAANDLVMDNNNNVQKCTTPGKSDANPPIWAKGVGETTTEANPDPQGEGAGGVAWENQGPMPENWDGTTPGQFGYFIADTESEPGRVFPGPPGQTWPPVIYVPDAVQIHFTAGWAADGTSVGDGPGQMPAVIKTAILMCIANWYENREAAMIGAFGELPNHVQMLLYSKKVIDFQPTRG